jgi:type IV pilus assembly protein PilC
MKLNYQARTRMGEIQSGVVEASDKEAASLVLKNHGLFVTTLEEMDVPVYAKKINIFERVTKKDVVMFSRQLSIMLKSNVALIESFRTIARQARNSNFREKILNIAEQIEGGSTLSKALSLYPKVFSAFYINMVKSGEASGRLSDVFVYLANYLEKEHEFRAKMQTAMIYPVFIICVFIGIAVVMFIYVLPQLIGVLKESGQELPLFTRILIAVSEFAKNWWWTLILGLIASAIVFFKVLRSKDGKIFFDRMLLNIPLINSFLKKFYLSRFALNLSTLVAGGLPIAQALEITGEVVGNNVYRDAIFETRDGVKRGETISSILERYPDIISPLFYQMTVVGEKTGSMDTSLLNVVEFYEGEVDRALDGFVKLLEPIIIIFLGIGVAIFVIGILLPLYSVGIV